MRTCPKKKKNNKKTKKVNKKNLVNKLHKLIVKKLKFNVNCHIRTCRNHNLFQI
jgi:hypothetical protein